MTKATIPTVRQAVIPSNAFVRINVVMSKSAEPVADIVKICGTKTRKKTDARATPASPYWNPHADIAQPFGKIDILDVVLCTGHYGQKYP